MTARQVTILHAPNHAPSTTSGAMIRVATRTAADSIGFSEAYRVMRMLGLVDGYRLHVGRGARDRRRGAKDVPILTRFDHVSLGSGAVQISEAVEPSRLAPDRWLTFSLFPSPAGRIAHLNLHPNARVAGWTTSVPRVREYAEAMASLERYVRLFRLEGFLPVVTGDLNHNSQEAPPRTPLPVWAPAEVFRRLDLGYWRQGIDYVAHDQRLQLTSRQVIDRAVTGSDHPWLLATFTRRNA
jgi:hypothetical protein